MEEIYTWIMKIISTCNNQFHFEAVDRLIDLFDEKYKEEKMTNELKYSRTIKWNEIHNIL